MQKLTVNCQFPLSAQELLLLYIYDLLKQVLYLFPDSRDGCGQQIYYVVKSPIEQTCVIFSHDERHCLAVSEDDQTLQLTTLQDKNVKELEEKTGNKHLSDEQTGDERAVVKFAESKQCIGGEKTGSQMIDTDDNSNTDVSSKSMNTLLSLLP